MGSLLMVLVLVALACKGPEGPAGPAGPAGPTPEAKAGAVVGMRPDVVAANTAPGKFTFWGWGFQPGEAITINMLKAIGGEDWIIGGESADDSGAFIRDAVSVVSAKLPPDLKAGVYTVKAVGNKGTVATCVFRVNPEPTPTSTPTPKPAATPTAAPKS
jgi:hypothetical protein